MPRVPDSTYILLVRHARTDWNSEFRFQGHADRPLSEAGRATIPLVTGSLVPWEPVHIYTSDLARAREMAEAVGDALGLPTTALEDLRECAYGEWEGLTIQEVEERFPDELAAWRADEADHVRGGGESLQQMQQRSWEAIGELADRHQGRAVAVFTHSGPVRGAVCRILGFSMAHRYRFQVDNASLTALRLSRSGRWQVTLLNQTSHLRAPRA